ncbi:hypothetical protein NDU88_011534 [Pleurodeles waltl]|uniref:Uncharacterized protein n=1 Tax=Pleurodeles waltl TaxID=8319 RepID=A0AAV7R395_PLEWA|nr:hypothetical protein NDU88_011534 [Pleurodeles waltl]
MRPRPGTPLQLVGGPSPGRLGPGASSVPTQSSDQQCAPRFPSGVPVWPNAARSSSSSRPPLLVAWPRPHEDCLHIEEAISNIAKHCWKLWPLFTLEPL